MMQIDSYLAKDENEMNYIVAHPENYEGLPLLVYLHGAGERGRQIDHLYRHGVARMVKEGHDIPAVVLCPQCPAFFIWNNMVKEVKALIDKVAKEYKVNPDRIVLTGSSMGGYGTWFTAMARPDLFAAIAPVCGGGMAWNAGVLTMPVWTCHGAKDGTVSINQTEEMVAALRTLGRDVTYERLEDYGHNAWDYAYTEQLMNWLLSKERG
jgi:predicted peptidase